MANRYWVATAGGSWASTTRWSATSGGASGASIPTAADSVFFDQVATYTVSGSGVCLDITVSAGTVSITATLAISGSMSLVAGTTFATTGSITFNSTTTTNTINTNGVSLNSASATTGIVFNGVGGKWTLNGPLTTLADTTLTNGTLDLNGYTLTTKEFISSNFNTRSIAFGSGNIAITTGKVNCGAVTGFTWTGTGGFTMDANAIRTNTFGTVGGSSSNAPNLTYGTGSTIQGFASGSWWGKLDFGSITGSLGTNDINVNSLVLGNNTSYANLTITTVGTGTINTNGKTIAALTVNAPSGTTTLLSAVTAPTITLTSGTLDLAGYTLTATTTATTAAGTKSITFNGGTIVCSAVTTTAWNNAAPTDFTTTAGTGTGTISMTGATAKTFVGGGSTYNCTLNQGGAGALTITGSNTFSNIANTVQPASVLFTAGTTNSFTRFSLNGTSGNLITLGSATAATHTLTTLSGIVNVNYLSISYSVATGTGSWYANTTSTNGGNNTGWLFYAPVSGQFMAFFS